MGLIGAPVMTTYIDSLVAALGEAGSARSSAGPGPTPPAPTCSP